jgi:hypothetical protein
MPKLVIEHRNNDFVGEFCAIGNVDIILTNVAYDVGPNVNPLQNRETQHVNIVLQCKYHFLNDQI